MIKRLSNMFLVLGLGLLPLLLGGCGYFRPLSIIPVQSRGGSALQPHFQQAFYYVTRDGTYRFILKSKPAGNTGVTQIMVIRVFWKPVPGLTPILSTAINATFEYIVITPSGTGRYSGAGFIRLHNGRHAAIMHATLVDGDLRLTASSGYFQNALGPSRIRGDFTADRDPRRSIAMLLQARRVYFIRSYHTRLARP